MYSKFTVSRWWIDSETTTYIIITNEVVSRESGNLVVGEFHHLCPILSIPTDFVVAHSHLISHCQIIFYAQSLSNVL